MTKTIEQLLDGLIAREGGYVNNPADRGGPTRYGITEHQARAYGFQGDMRELPVALAREIYRSIYWMRPGFASIAARMPRLAAELFDTAVNMGPKIAATFLQRMLNGLNRGASDYPDIAADGDIGPMTLHAQELLIQRRGVDAAETVLLRLADALQAVRYLEIAERNPSQEAFLFGWIMNRVGEAA